jgi:hypothetical protein
MDPLPMLYVSVMSQFDFLNHNVPARLCVAKGFAGRLRLSFSV